MIIGIPIATSFVISLVVYIVYSKLMTYELVDPTTGKGKYVCNGGSKAGQTTKKNISLVAPDAR